ncbi:MAG TPA: L-fucose/L-arabinose isomerase family protein [Candidatus Dormibacteraeota bacterium]|nr:L-fucose/L-arabinose isomerase family protein [Candidatus Dormibacteraeota bacterium]
MARVGLLSFSDGRSFVNLDLREFVAGVERQIAGHLRAAGHEVITADAIVEDNELACREARLVAASHPDVTIFNFPVWAFPHFSVLAATETTGPILLFSNISPQYPGMVGMLAAAGALEQTGRRHGRAWGEITEPEVAARVGSWVAAGSAQSALRGSTFGRIGGRPMGMYTAVADPAQWMAKFGVDVEEIDQWEVVRRAELVSPARAAAGRLWLEQHSAEVRYDGQQLTPELLERQVRSYHAMRELIDEWHLDFSGIKGQPELTTHFATMDVTEAFLNDPYDWEGSKETHVCATEADMDGALTMQVLKQLSHTPVLFADLRCYDRDNDVWDLCNSGQHATWYAARSSDPMENMRKVHLLPEGFYFPAGGASIHHVAAPGEITLARLTRPNGRYRMQVIKGEIVNLEDATTERLMRASTYEWPHAFVRMEATAEEVLGRFGANHIHAIPGDHVDALSAFCQLADVDFDGFGPRA